MDRQRVARELTRLARDLSAAPRPWDERTVSQWHRKVTGLIKDVKADEKEVYGLFRTAITRDSKESTVNHLQATRDAALKLRTTVSDLVRALEGLWQYADMSMPEDD